MVAVVPEKIILRSTTILSLNDRFSRLTKVMPRRKMARCQMMQNIQTALADDTLLAHDLSPADQNAVNLSQDGSAQLQQLQQGEEAGRLNYLPVHMRLGFAAQFGWQSRGGFRGFWRGYSRYQPFYPARPYSSSFYASRPYGGSFYPSRPYSGQYRGYTPCRGGDRYGYGQGRGWRGYYPYGGPAGCYMPWAPPGVWRPFYRYNNCYSGPQSFQYQRGRGWRGFRGGRWMPWGWHSHRGGRRGGGQAPRVPTKEELDAQIDDYMAKADVPEAPAEG